MSDALTVPASIEEVVQRYDKKDEPFTEHNVVAELSAARQALVDPSDAERAGAWAEVLAFGLAAGHHENPWNSYFGPQWSGVSEDGTKVFGPDIAGTPPTVVDHWAGRARSLKHPFLKARYADLAWEMSRIIAKRRRDPEDARVAIDAYIEAIPRMESDHEPVLFAIRALDLAVLTGDRQRVDRARSAVMNVHRAIRKRGRGLWWHAVDRLLEDKKAGVTDEERAELVADLESIVAFGSDADDPTQFHPHEAKDAAERLIPYYRRLNRFDDIRRLHTRIGEAFEQSAALAEPMLAAAWLQTATEQYRNAGLKEERDRTRILMQEKIGMAGENLQSFEHKIEISRDDMEKFLDMVVVDDLATTFVRMAWEFLLKRAKLEERVQKTLKEAPLMAHIPQEIMASNRVAARIGSVEDDLLGRLFHQSQFEFQFATPWLAQAFRRLYEKHDVVPEAFAGWANRLALFEDMSLLVEGVRAWEREDHVKAAHVLVPQIERALRKIADDLEVPVTKAHPTVPGTSVVIGIGEILNNAKVAEALGTDLTFHLQALYSDPRGSNLRNEIAHGLMHTDAFHWHLGNLIIHTLLMLGVWKEFGARSQGATRPSV